MPDSGRFMVIEDDVTSQGKKFKEPVARNRNLTNLGPAGSPSLPRILSIYLFYLLACV